MKLLVCVVIALVHSVDYVSADQFERYSAYLDALSLSDPKPSVANIAGGFGASSGTFYAAVSYTNYDLQTRVDGDDDGSIALGLGLGDPGSIAAELTLGITSVSTAYWGNGKFADEGNLSVKLHHTVSPILGGAAASISLGASNLVGWGATTQNPTNYFGAYSEVIYFGEFNQHGLMYSAGFGTGISDSETEADAFFGVGWGYDDYNLSVSRVGSETHLTGMLFFPQLPQVALAVSQADIFDERDAQRTIVTISYASKIF